MSSLYELFTYMQRAVLYGIKRKLTAHVNGMRDYSTELIKSSYVMCLVKFVILSINIYVL